jgi:hypothetical protein
MDPSKHTIGDDYGVIAANPTRFTDWNALNDGDYKKFTKTYDLVTGDIGGYSDNYSELQEVNFRDLQWGQFS